MSDVGVDRKPVWSGLGLSAVAAGAATASLVLSGVAAGAAVAGVGTLLLITAGVRGRLSGIDWGGLVMFGGVLVTGVGGGYPGPLLGGMVGTVVAWDAADHAVGLGEHLGHEAPSSRAAVVHVAVATAVGTGGAAVGYGVYRLAGGGQPASALVVLLLGAVFITWALRR